MKDLKIFIFIFFPLWQACYQPPIISYHTTPANRPIFEVSPYPATSEWVKNIKTTRRINGDRYADLHLDAKGNSYIASFVMHEDRTEGAYLVKVDKTGEKLWEVISKGEGNARAYGMAINHQEEKIWLVGFFNHTISFGDKIATSTSQSLFIAQFDLNGNCQQIIPSKGGATGFNCILDNLGNLYVSGNCEQELSIGTCQMDSFSSADHFLAKLSPHGICEWIIPSQGLHTHRMASDSRGGIYLAGSFYDHFSTQNTNLSTLNSFDADGLLLKYNSDGGLEWYQQIGNKGNERYGYRSSEAISFIDITPSDQIFVVGNLEGVFEYEGKPFSEKGDHLLYVVQYTPDGKEQNFTPIAKGLTRGAIGTIAVDADFAYISSMAKDTLKLRDTLISAPSPNMSFVSKYDHDFSTLEWIRPIEQKSDATFRSIQVSPWGLFAAGHYRQQLSLPPLNIQADSTWHELFLTRISTSVQN